MKRIIFLFIIILISSILFPVERIVLRQSDSVDLLEKMNSNEVFVKWLMGVDLDRNQNAYFMDVRYSTIVGVDIITGKRIATISSKGQAPAELHRPTAVSVNGNRVFVADKGYGGIKIFSLKGEFIKAFKTNTPPDWLEVSTKNEMLVKESNSDSTPVISVYNIDGKKKKNLITFGIKPKTDRTSFILNKKFIFKIDNDGNIVVLHFLKRLIRKFDTGGVLLWEKKLENEILDKFDTDDQKVQYNKGSISGTRAVFGLDIDPENNIVIGHVGGGSIYSKEGKLVGLLVFEPLMNLDLFKVLQDKILTINTFGNIIRVYPYQKGGENE
jgi:DNA-binding beta-propeller fold protein YncE